MTQFPLYPPLLSLSHIYSSSLPLLPHLYFLQLTSPLISKMSSTGSVESGKPPKVGHFSNSDLKHLQTKKEINTLLLTNYSRSPILLCIPDWLCSGGDREGSARYCCLYWRHPFCFWKMGWRHTERGQRQERWHRAGEKILHLWRKSWDICQTVPGWWHKCVAQSSYQHQSLNLNFTQQIEGVGLGLGAWLSITAFACFSVQLQVVDDGSSATSPESESGPAKSLRYKGEFEPQLCMIYMLLKQTNAKIIIITLDNDSSFVSLRHSRDSQNNQAGRQPLRLLTAFLFLSSL